MSDYIKREDAVRRIAVLMAAEAESDGCEDQHMDNYIEYASEDLADIPSADVAPVRHGRWEEQDKKYRIYSCSKCNKVALFEKWGDAVKPYDYCPNCGAKMDEGE